ncbi:Presequence translocated-associated motor subunit pam17, mitochondrial [Smittium culicis]|uniref:Presequence translocated-associated motor subunit PAM17 n=1 Tax=Smittium culicis TaxID=133412 RepID=A0A1R1XH39_9FUNG|nr:Presequence translocated-associated motor subunit pam17, mitochondrial [Smittium culicis]
MVSGATYLSTIPLGEIPDFGTGIDPMFTISACVLVCGALGFTAGGIFGRTLWKLMNRRELTRMDIKEKVYFEHIQNNRSDPRLSSYRNPLPDYYGERVTSVKGYRTWLKKQRIHESKGMSKADLD